MPHSSSFPSGHSAAAFAFATGACIELPVLAVPLAPLAGAVAYSRVHTGVHYPSDVAVGVGIGVGSGLLATRWPPR
jgi:membrane-associated phospholipid phosphatase